MPKSSPRQLIAFLRPFYPRPAADRSGEALGGNALWRQRAGHDCHGVAHADLLRVQHGTSRPSRATWMRSATSNTCGTGRLWRPVSGATVSARPSPADCRNQKDAAPAHWRGATSPAARARRSEWPMRCCACALRLSFPPSRTIVERAIIARDFASPPVDANPRAPNASLGNRPEWTDQIDPGSGRTTALVARRIRKRFKV